MGMGIKEFIKSMASALKGVIIDPFRSVIINDNFYLNKKLGIMFYKPKAWGFIHVKQFGKLKDDQLLNDDFEGNKKKIWKNLPDPICIITKYFKDLPEEKGIFSPTITLHIAHKSEVESPDGESFEEVTAMSQYTTRLMLKDFKVIEKLEDYMISGCNFSEYNAEYLFEHTDLICPLKVELNVLKVKHNDYYYDFNLHQSRAQNQIATAEFEKFKKCIKLI